MSDEKKTLDLDQLFGQADPIKLKLKGAEYELLPIEGIGPKQAVKFQKLQLRAQKLQSLKTNPESMDAKQAQELDDLFDEMLKILCPELPLSEMTSVQKIRSVLFYMEQTQGKKILEAALGESLTGVMPSVN